MTDGTTEQTVSSRLVEAQGLLMESKTTLTDMRTTRLSTGGPSDPRPGIETGLGVANDRLAELRSQLDGGTQQAQRIQTPEGQAILKDLAGEVGYTFSLSAVAPIELPPVTKTQSSILSKFTGFFRK